MEDRITPEEEAAWQELEQKTTHLAPAIPGIRPQRPYALSPGHDTLNRIAELLGVNPNDHEALVSKCRSLVDRGDVVVTWFAGQIVAVTLQDEEGRVTSVLAEVGNPPSGAE